MLGYSSVTIYLGNERNEEEYPGNVTRFEALNLLVIKTFLIGTLHNNTSYVAQNKSRYPNWKQRRLD